MEIVELAGDAPRAAACGVLLTEVPLFVRYGLTAAVAADRLLAASVDPRHTVLVVLDGVDVVGLAWVVREGGFARSAYLKQLAVAPRAQGQGVGARLMDEVERRHLQPAGIVLLATATNAAAQRFYEARGYGRVGMMPRYAHPDHDEVIYLKPAARRDGGSGVGDSEHEPLAGGHPDAPVEQGGRGLDIPADVDLPT
jgi:ribosomal protein S18 acetylase RimI-like enzyme